MSNKNESPSTFLNILLILLIIGYGTFPTLFEKISVRVSSPFFALADSIEYVTDYVFEVLFSSTKTLLDKQKTIIKKNDALLTENLFLQSRLRFHNTKILDVDDVIYSSVLVRPPRTRFDKIIINKGIKDGIILNSQVYSSNKNLIGKISEITDYYSTVEIFSSPTSVIPVSINDFLSNAMGTGGGGILVEVSSKVKVSLDDNIFFHGDRKIPIAKVVKVDKKIVDPIQIVYGYLYEDIYNLSDVFVEKYE